jgi:hypothetical protein
MLMHDTNDSPESDTSREQLGGREMSQEEHEKILGKIDVPMVRVPYQN